MKNTYYVIINKYFVEFQLTSEDFDQEIVTKSSLLDSGALGAEVTNDDTDQQQDKKKCDIKVQMVQINSIMIGVKQLEEKTIKIQSGQESFEYRHLDEMLTRNLEALDAIETGANEDLRRLRRNCVEVINRCFSCLESKTTSSNLDVEPAVTQNCAPKTNLMDNTASSNQV